MLKNTLQKQVTIKSHIIANLKNVKHPHNGSNCQISHATNLSTTLNRTGVRVAIEYQNIQM